MSERLLQTLRSLTGYVGFIAYGYVILRMLLVSGKPQQYKSGRASLLLRPLYLIVITVLFTCMGIIFWRPLPWSFGSVWQWLGIVLFYGSLFMYFFAMYSLRGSFNVSSGFAVSLPQGHQLITRGAFAVVRHPMYVSVIIFSWGGLLLFQNWTMLLMSVLMFGLIRRAHIEDKLLEQVYGEQWREYAANTSSWWPRMISKGK